MTMSSTSSPNESHENGEHPAFLAHHFESHQQQFAAGKLGMWIFLLTEILLFSGVFCAYAVFRANHPEIFEWAHRFLDKTLGAINTAVLITSSFTMAWAVRAAQKNQRRLCTALLAVTLLGGFGFLGIKFVEYQKKWKEGLLVASSFKPSEEALKSLESSVPGHDKIISKPEDIPHNAGIFFSIYFCMTGLHGLHILAGMSAIGWVLVRSAKGHFSSEYFGPVDYAGLYWHLVDLIWIYLFPLLYLIH
jgi:cytochrome c oxidase subunit III